MNAKCIATLTLTLALGVCIAGGNLGASNFPRDTCANEKASQVDAKVTYSGNKVRCGIGFKVFGLGGGLFGPTCWDLKSTTPAHQECLMETMTGSYCVYERDLAVVLEACRCVQLTVFGTGLLFPTCTCDNIGGMSTVEDFQTVPCLQE